ncbi:MAG: hypothetical protein EPO42_12355 [Gallionellaceae bacterium]|nr:MAG: hypothetical protein EPO42_12355 [Gallionellaceae bacterium]
MNFSKSDLPHIKWSLLAFMLSLLMGGSAIWMGDEYDTSALEDRQNAQKQVIDARNKLAAAQNDLENMSTYALEYAALVDHKIIGGEQRLDWMEGLEKLRQQHHVMDFKYTIAPQQSYAPNPPLVSGNFEISMSGVTLQMDLLHEMQLVKFFQSLREEIKGWFVVDHCTLNRPDSAGSPLAGASFVPQLKAECSGGWITLKSGDAP